MFGKSPGICTWNWGGGARFTPACPGLPRPYSLRLQKIYKTYFSCTLRINVRDDHNRSDSTAYSRKPKHVPRRFENTKMGFLDVKHVSTYSISSIIWCALAPSRTRNMTASLSREWFNKSSSSLRFFEVKTSQTFWADNVRLVLNVLCIVIVVCLSDVKDS